MQRNAAGNARTARRRTCAQKGEQVQVYLENDFGNSVDRFMAQLGLVGVAKIPSSNVTNDVELNVRGRFEFLGDNVKEKKSLYNCFYLLLYLGINF